MSPIPARIAAASAVRIDTTIPLWGVLCALSAVLVQLVAVSVWANLESRQNDQNTDDLRKIEEVLERARAERAILVRLEERANAQSAQLDRIEDRLEHLERRR